MHFICEKNKSKRNPTLFSVSFCRGAMNTLPEDVLRTIYQWLDPRCHNDFAISSRRLYNFHANIFRPFKHPKPLSNPSHTLSRKNQLQSEPSCLNPHMYHAPGTMYRFLEHYENQTLRELHNEGLPNQLHRLTRILRELIHQWNCFTCDDNFLYDYPLHITPKEWAWCYCCTKYAVPFSQAVPAGAYDFLRDIFTGHQLIYFS